ncbi:unnamed protein product, partial [Phaeothamnion confervicola]
RYVAKLRAADVALVRVIANYGGRDAVDASDVDEGNTALHWAVAGNFGPAAVHALLVAGAVPDLLNKDGKTPAELAVALGNTRAARFLEQ